MIIRDGTGTDSFTFASFVSSYLVNLSTGEFERVGGLYENTLVDIENIFAGSGNDSLVGSAANNLIEGGDGNDTINALGGQDTINAGDGDDVIIDTESAGTSDSDEYNGGLGTDTVVAERAWTDAVVFDLMQGVQTVGGATRDTYSSIENLTVSGNARMIGNDDDNLLIANDSFAIGDNLIEGGGGNDTIYGGGGSDTLRGGTGIDSLYGESGDDNLGFDANTLGADNLFDGGDGTDTFDFSVFNGSYLADLATGFFDLLGTGGFENTLIDIENIAAGNGNDSLVGDDGDNVINGGDGNDTISSGAGDDTLIGGSGNDTLDGGAGADELDGGDGIDTASYAGSSSRVIVRLFDSLTLGGDADGDTLTGIENLIGSDHNDALIGSFNEGNRLEGGAGDDILRGLSGADTLIGGAGHDTLIGGAGADELDGGAGIDTASYAGSSSRVIVRLWDGTTLGGDADGDTLIGIENLTGSAHNDALIGAFDQGNLLDGAAGDDILRGLSGDDTLIGGAGADELDGGDGIDTASYADSVSRVIVRLNDGLALGGDAFGDTFNSIENLTGSAHNDTLIEVFDQGNLLDGAADDDILRGLSGDDTLIGGAGADELDGGAGIDTASYAGSSSRVIVRLFDSLTLGGDADGDTLTGIENLIGSDHNDALIGSFNEGNRLEGGEGDDMLRGLSGNDTLIGGAGADELDGGAGIDTASYAGSSSRVIVRLFDSLTLGGDADGDTLTGIENLIGSDHNDALIGSFNEGNQLEGGAGDDMLRGLSGADTLIGGAGNDTLDGGGADGETDVFVLLPGAGDDVIRDFADNEDRLEFGGGITSLDDLTFTQQASDVLIAYHSTDSVLVENMTITTLSDDISFV